MLEVHPPHRAADGWREFFVHIGTITVGLLIAIGLEQGVEKLHQLHQRSALQRDLHDEAERNRGVLVRDLSIESERDWFRAVLQALAHAPRGAPQSLLLPPTPCLPGTIGANTANAPTRYFAPSEAVWSAARDAGLIALMPADEARAYSRLAHNDALLGEARDEFARRCDRLVSLQLRFAVPTPSGEALQWTLAPTDAEALADAAAAADTANRGLLFRLRYTIHYEEAILGGAKALDDLLLGAKDADQ